MIAAAWEKVGESGTTRLAEEGGRTFPTAEAERQLVNDVVGVAIAALDANAVGLARALLDGLATELSED